ncbi:MAG: hypothetical protein AAGF47_02005 [Planctomycetota bacterium]
MRRPLIAATSLVLALPAAAQSDELFQIVVTEQGNPGNQIFVGGSSLPDLVNDLGDTTGEFESFDGLAFDATLDYGGVESAIDISFDPAGGSTGGDLLVINNLLGFSGGPITFDSADGEIGDQLEDFFLGDGEDGIEDAVEQFLAAIAEQSLVAATDGNPLASTARTARSSFMRFGLFSDVTPTDRELWRIHSDRTNPTNGQNEPLGDEPAFDSGFDPGFDPGFDEIDDGASPSLFSATQGAAERRYGFARVRADFRGQSVDADGFEGPAFDLNLSGEIRFHSRVSAVIGIPLAFHSVGDGDVYNAGLVLGLPIRLLIPDKHETVGVKWQVTPFGGVDALFSYDLASAGLLYNLGLNNVIAFDYGPVSLVTSQQYTFHQSITLEADDFSIDPSVDQQILKLGGKLQYSVSDNFYIYGGGIWTDFVEDAAIDNYATALAGLGLRASNGFNFVIGYEGDFGDDYEAHGGSVTLQLPF